MLESLSSCWQFSEAQGQPHPRHLWLVLSPEASCLCHLGHMGAVDFKTALVINRL